ncbi:rhomboid family intramembrane serine protease [Streptomonospora nanhaiensis]|uniref:Membrane associated rhomboid family serine protease n=1 Tax=Streptomonospora nanhaiensis TaxID=1323731 RepID=A0A853BS48_9ACTN|nr:rhomboid family intramembrane serine protease [Streptomonospora nanhaiensis]MBV2364288.1 rhomboid family intramembrane serine protease [Streptomonospora nanhaiensis]MBX9390395.1 rhomboid family intramembrane serine protease [Streptomonospora nanhaiensis]NYI97172.1 membrane associated rhomboid family serine protease [Streptomonospora nanhaiensis]
MASSPTGGTEPGAAAVPTCYRHRDRETYLRCSRCDRPICPDCIREAPVGQHCPECVAEGRRGMRQARTVFGGRVADRPLVTWVLLGLMGLGFVAQLAVPQLVGLLGMSGYYAVVDGQWYRLLTAAFLHGGVMHLLFNGMALYVLGQQVETVLGHARYLALWVLSAVGGSVLSLLVVPQTMSVGASGAIFGLFGAVFVIGRRLRLDTRFVVGLLAVNLLITFLVPNISWTGHIGGLVTGLLLAAAYAYLPPGSGRPGAARRRGQAAAHALATAGVVALLAAGAVAGTALMGL